MRNAFRFLIVPLALAAVNICAGDDGRKPGTEIGAPGEVVLFDADRDGAGLFTNTTCRWVEGSDYVPVAKMVESGGSQWLEFSYKGSKGMARSFFECGATVKEQLKAGGIISGIKVVIDYDKDDFGKLSFLGFTATGIYSMETVLKKGTHEYLLRDGFHHQAPKWDLLSVFGIFNHAKPESAANFRLKKVVLLVTAEGDGAEKLELTFVRPVQEIIFASTPLDGQGQFKPGYEWDKLAEISSFSYAGDKPVQAEASPVKARIGYDGDNIFLRVAAEFPTAPFANVKRNDMEVYQDEALELFFSGRPDNSRKIQWVVNAGGTVFDYLHDFDEDAMAVVTRMEWNAPHRKNLVYADGRMTYELAFALKDLRIEPSQQPFIGFQMALDYIGRAGRLRAPLRWSSAPGIGYFPDPRAFGFLVLNRRPFGAGTIKAADVRKLPGAERDVCDIFIKAELAGFAPGKYTATQWLTAPDNTVAEKSEELSLGNNQALTFYLPNMKNFDGTYTWTLGIKNGAGDRRVFALNFKNEAEIIDLFGSNLQWPRPKQVMRAGAGAFNAGEKHALSVPENATDRTLLTARLFQEKLLGYAGSEYRIVKGGKQDVILRLAGEVRFSGKTEKLKPEGYHLKVTPELVEITGADEPGLFYGTLAFIQLLKAPMKRLDTAPVQCVEILDWPDLPKRRARSCYLPDQVGNKVEEKAPLDHLLAWIDRFVADNKFNMFSIDAENMTIFKRRPEVNVNLANRQYTLDDWRKISEFCNERFIKLIPALPAGGHGSWLIRARPEFQEKGRTSMPNVAHPDYFPIYRDCTLDLLEATGCEYFSPHLDEWWHTPKPGETPDELISGKTRPQAMLDFILQLHQLLKEHNVKLVVWNDMLTPAHNGRRYDVYKITDRLPKDIIIAAWCGCPGGCAEYFHNKGFTEFWGDSTGFSPSPDPKTKHLFGGYGNSLYCWWGGGDSYNGQGEQTWMANWFRGADYAWNFYQGNEKSVTDEIQAGVFPALSAMFAVNPNPAASQDVVPIDIAPALDTLLAKFMKSYWPDDYKNSVAPVILPEGETAMGNIPIRFSTESKNCVIVDQNQKVEFPVSGKYSSLIFLQSVINPRDINKELAGMAFSWRTWHMGWPLGSYLVEYTDGTTSRFIVHFGQDIYWLRTRPLGGGTLYNRYIFHPKDANGAYVFLYQSEWVNPYPEKEIRMVSFQDEPRIPLKTAIFAISGRKAKAPSSRP